MQRQKLIDRAIAAYYGLAIGDALGATVEFMTPNEIKRQYGVHQKIMGGGWLKLAPGQVTDDTTMSIALANCIIEDQQVIAEHCATAFLQWMKSKPIDIGNTVRRGLVRFRRTGVAHGEPCDYDAGNGACMRTLPIALYSFGLSAEEILHASHSQTHVTHNNLLSDKSTQLVINMIHGALNNKTTMELLHDYVQPFIQHHPEFHFRGKIHSNPTGYIVETLQVVFQGLFDNDSFETVLIDVVNQGGDADTTGAIAGMIAGAIYGMEGIPKHWLKALDPEVSATCQRQAKALIKMSKGYQNLM